MLAIYVHSLAHDYVFGIGPLVILLLVYCFALIMRNKWSWIFYCSATIGLVVLYRYIGFLGAIITLSDDGIEGGLPYQVFYGIGVTCSIIGVILSVVVPLVLYLRRSTGPEQPSK